MQLAQRILARAVELVPRRVRRNPAVVGGALVSIGELLVHADTWAAAGPLLAGVLIRFFVVPASEADTDAP
jgi:hypothetical protein